MAEFRDRVDIAAPPETVFAYLTTDAGMTAWMGQYAELDPKPGGRFAVDIAGHPVRGEFVVVDPPNRVVVTWGFAGSEALPAGTSTVEFLLTRTPDGTRLELCHAGLPDTEVRGHADGWGHFLPRLVIAGSGRDAGTDTWRPLADVPPQPHKPTTDRPNGATNT